MISREDVDRLRERRPTPDRPVLSVYLDVDQSRAANLNREFVAALRSRLKTLEQRLPDAERAAFRADASRVEDFATHYEPHAKTLVLFADGAPDSLWTGELQAPLPSDVRFEATPYVAPLVEAFDRYRRHGVVLVDKERARFFTVFLAEIEEQGEALATADTHHKSASGTDHLRSQMQFQRQDEMHVRWHLRHVVELIDRMARAHPFDRLVVGGPAEAVGELVRLLSRPLAERIVEAPSISIDAPAAAILHAALECVERATQAAEDSALPAMLDWRSCGLEATLVALQEGRVQVLVHAEGFSARGGECTRCRALVASEVGEACGYCGGPLLAHDDVVARMVVRAPEWGASVHTVRGGAATRLIEAGGVGAALRF